MPHSARRYQKPAVNELKALLASSEDLLESLGDQSGAAVDEFRDRLTATVAKTKQRLGNSADSVSAVPISSTSDICRIASVNLSVRTFESSTSNTRSERTINMSPWTNSRCVEECSQYSLIE